MGKKSNALMAFTVGAVAGAALGVLYAPEKGTLTREKLLSRLDKYKELLQGFLDEIMEGMEAEGENGAYAKDQSVVDAKNKANQLLNDVDDMLDQMRSSGKS